MGQCHRPLSLFLLIFSSVWMLACGGGDGSNDEGSSPTAEDAAQGSGDAEDEADAETDADPDNDVPSDAGDLSDSDLPRPDVAADVPDPSDTGVTDAEVDGPRDVLTDAPDEEVVPDVDLDHLVHDPSDLRWDGSDTGEPDGGMLDSGSDAGWDVGFDSGGLTDSGDAGEDGTSSDPCLACTESQACVDLPEPGCVCLAGAIDPAGCDDGIAVALFSVPSFTAPGTNMPIDVQVRGASRCEVHVPALDVQYLLNAAELERGTTIEVPITPDDATALRSQTSNHLSLVQLLCAGPGESTPRLVASTGSIWANWTFGEVEVDEPVVAAGTRVDLCVPAGEARTCYVTGTSQRDGETTHFEDFPAEAGESACVSLVVESSTAFNVMCAGPADRLWFATTFVAVEAGITRLEFDRVVGGTLGLVTGVTWEAVGVPGCSLSTGEETYDLPPSGSRRVWVRDPSDISLRCGDFERSRAIFLQGLRQWRISSPEPGRIDAHIDGDWLAPCEISITLGAELVGSAEVPVNTTFLVLNGVGTESIGMNLRCSGGGRVIEQTQIVEPIWPRIERLDVTPQVLPESGGDLEICYEAPLATDCALYVRGSAPGATFTGLPPSDCVSVSVGPGRDERVQLICSYRDGDYSSRDSAAVVVPRGVSIDQFAFDEPLLGEAGEMTVRWQTTEAANCTLQFGSEMPQDVPVDGSFSFLAARDGFVTLACTSADGTIRADTQRYYIGYGLRNLRAEFASDDAVTVRYTVTPGVDCGLETIVDGVSTVPELETAGSWFIPVSSIFHLELTGVLRCTTPAGTDEYPISLESARIDITVERVPGDPSLVTTSWSAPGFNRCLLTGGLGEATFLPFGTWSTNVDPVGAIPWTFTCTSSYGEPLLAVDGEVPAP